MTPPREWSGIAGDPTPHDVLFIAVVRLPAGESSFMREALEEAAPTMNATSPEFDRSIPVRDVEDSDVETALKALGLWDERLVA